MFAFVKPKLWKLYVLEHYIYNLFTATTGGFKTIWRYMH